MACIGNVLRSVSHQSAPAKARTGIVDQNIHEGLQPFKGYRISLSWENRMTLEVWNDRFRGVVPKTPSIKPYGDLHPTVQLHSNIVK